MAPVHLVLVSKTFSALNWAKHTLLRTEMGATHHRIIMFGIWGNTRLRTSDLVLVLSSENSPASSCRLSFVQAAMARSPKCCECGPSFSTLWNTVARRPRFSGWSRHWGHLGPARCSRWFGFHRLHIKIRHTCTCFDYPTDHKVQLYGVHEFYCTVQQRTLHVNSDACCKLINFSMTKHRNAFVRPQQINKGLRQVRSYHPSGLCETSAHVQ